MGELPEFRNPVVTVGSFDGVHRGHLYLLSVLRERAQMLGGEVVVVTFGVHPRRVLEGASGEVGGVSGSDFEASGELRLLTSNEEKVRLLEAAGVDNLIVMPFDAEVAAWSAEEFVRDFLVGRVGVRELVVGYNHRLGRGREGGVEELGALGVKYGFGVFEVGRFGSRNADGDFGYADGLGEDFGGSGCVEKISSTAIREALDRGDLALAEWMLGRRIIES
ncbi:MAG: hypothetical protein LBV38_03350 [Alistipes sp.]|nr:hypothetical protein [Alistipes sp.]